MSQSVPHHGPKGIGEVVRKQLLAMISSGELRAGDKIGSERELAERFSISRSTLRDVLGDLEREGAVRRLPGRGGGTFVSFERKLERNLSNILGIPALLVSQGFVAGTQVVGTRLCAADETRAKALRLDAGALVVEILRIRLADGIPLSLEQANIPAALCPGLLDLPLGGSLYETLERHYGIYASEAIENIEVVRATKQESSVLGTVSGSPLFAISRTTTDRGGRTFEFSYDLFRTDRVRITVRSPSKTDHEELTTVSDMVNVASN